MASYIFNVVVDGSDLLLHFLFKGDNNVKL